MMRLLVLTSLLSLGACDVQTTDDSTSQPATAPAASEPMAPEPTAPVSIPVTTPSRPDANPQPSLREPDAQPLPDEKSALGAARRLADYCDAVATRRYSAAYAYWSDKGQASGMTLKQFADSFAKYAAYDCHVGKPGDTEGAAGSIYVEIPVQVTGALTRGGGFLLEGPMTLRRVNDVDGSTAEQRRWHISASGLKPRP